MAIDLEELEKLIAEARKGPLRVVETPLAYGSRCTINRPDGSIVCDTVINRRDAALIVAAVNALPELIAMARESERLREALAEIARCNQYMSEADTNYEYEMRQIELCRLIKTRTALKEKPQ